MSQDMANPSTPAPWQRHGFSTVSGYIKAEGAQRVIDFMTQVLGASIIYRQLGDNGVFVKHSSLRLGGSTIMVADATEEHPPSPAWFHVYVPDVDATYKSALNFSGATSVQEPRDEVYGDRMGGVKDPVGNTWWIATHKQAPPACNAAANST